MPVIKHIGLLLFSASFAAGAAEIPLTQADLLGTWQIEKESVNADGSGARGLNTTWTFRNDGTMEGISQENDSHARIEQLKAVLNYSVEDGKLKKQAAPGRSKMETCAATARDGNKMVLKCQSIYFFMTKK
ncbi:lipocalin-like domain-containing protein [Methylomonas koyamae]|uniref:lipocalin family protein n=1 Tax=Methylomonas koyamae TaxID=702114 RepID=UPI00287336E0|nr:lipocalin family protein [Methylomonas koyamae]WNB74865.1 lipocalin family protein [Methylomonas koyamae]